MARTAVFDLDGTLVDSAPDLAASLNRLLAARGFPAHSLAAVTGMVGDGARVLVQRGFAAHGVVLDEAGLAAATAAFLADYNGALVVETRLYPGAEAALAALAQAGWRLAVCTNKPESAARRILAALGVAEHFAALGGGDSFPTRKPDPAHLAATLAAAGGEAARAVMIGDHHNDVAAARGLGLPCVWAAWGYAATDPGADAAAADFGAVPGLLERLLPG